MGNWDQEGQAGRRERRARALWQVQGAGLPWSTLSREERDSVYALADAVEASDRAAMETPSVGIAIGRAEAAAALRAHVPAVVDLEEATRRAADMAGHRGAGDAVAEMAKTVGTARSHRPMRWPLTTIGRSLIAMALFAAMAAGLLYAGLLLVGANGG